MDAWQERRSDEKVKKVFNTEGACTPELHYMVNISERLQEIKDLVDRGAYFTMNRARQYGKTTTLHALQSYLSDEYFVLYLDFQFLSQANFENEFAFVRAFSREIYTVLRKADVSPELLKNLKSFMNGNENCDMGTLFLTLSDWCEESEKPVVLIIDEVDSAANNQVFLDFLSQLRGYYIHREKRPTFQSVILAGVYDVKHVKYRIRSEEAHKENSPWVIAADFRVVMSLSREGILGMLREYEADHHTGMDQEEMAKLLYDYSSGYPYLVSRFCKLMDEQVCRMEGYDLHEKVWTREGFLEAEKILLAEKNALFESLANKINENQELRKIIYAILFLGKEIPYNSLIKEIEIAEMFGFVKNEHNKVMIANRIFETVFYNLFLSEEVIHSQIYEKALSYKQQFIENGHLNVELVLEKFVQTFQDLYGNQPEKFHEEAGRKYFLLFLKPIINGTGNSYIEARTRDMKRTDVVIDYRREQFVVGLKIWHGAKYHEEGEKQTVEYLESHHLEKGYMLTFNFNKKKEVGVHRVMYGEKTLVEAFV